MYQIVKGQFDMKLYFKKYYNGSEVDGIWLKTYDRKQETRCQKPKHTIWGWGQEWGTTDSMLRLVILERLKNIETTDFEDVVTLVYPPVIKHGIAQWTIHR